MEIRPALVSVTERAFLFTFKCTVRETLESNGTNFDASTRFITATADKMLGNSKITVVYESKNLELRLKSSAMLQIEKGTPQIKADVVVSL